jgi:hypothetical protein
MMMAKLLKMGDEGPEVQHLQELLKNNGYYDCPECTLDGDFGELTHSAVQEFQGGHIDWNKEPLNPDGEVGDKTWWALENPHGKPQTSGIKAEIPAGTTVLRESILELALEYHATPTQEIPKGSNGGDGVDEITGGWKAPWCAMFVCWVIFKATGLTPFKKKREAACINLYKMAKANNWWRDKDNYTPLPGDVFIMLYETNGQLNGKGHTGFVLRAAADGSEFNTCEGNCGDRVKKGKRKRSQGTLKGYINFYPADEQPDRVEHGVESATEVGNDKTR